MKSSWLGLLVLSRVLLSFAPIAQDLDATPPRNRFQVTPPTAAGFFLLEEH